MDKYNVKTDFWGNKTYYDTRGNEIGHEESSWLGGTGLYKDGHRVGDIKVDSLGRDSISLKSNSWFGFDKVMSNASNHPDWHYRHDGEFDNGGDD